MQSGTPVFVDTSVLVYVSRPNAVQHPRAVQALCLLEDEDAPPWLSFQVLREYLAVTTRPQAGWPALTMSEALADVAELRASFYVADDQPDGFDRPLRLLAGHPGSGKQVHDANLVSSMLGHGVTRLLTFNARDFRRFEPLVEVIEP